MTADAFARIPSTWGAPVSTISWNARENRKSPTSTLGLFPQTVFADGRPRRRTLSSTTSSCKSVAVWMNSAAVEFIHTATLLHDDVVDDSVLRRGRPSANTVWGNKPSVLVGDFLFSRAFQLMVETGAPQVLGILANASAIIAEGEVMQLRSAKNLAVSEGDYLKVITAKTAALFAAAAEAGAMIAGANEAHSRAMHAYGHHLGIAFQLVDDALDYSGRQAVMGKSVGDDFRECKVTLPIILSLVNASDEERRFWRKTIEVSVQEEGDLSRAIEFLERGGALAATVERARRYAREAREALAISPPGEIRSALADIADFVVERAY